MLEKLTQILFKNKIAFALFKYLIPVVAGMLLLLTFQLFFKQDSQYTASSASSSSSAASVSSASSAASSATSKTTRKKTTKTIGYLQLPASGYMPAASSITTIIEEEELTTAATSASSSTSASASSASTNKTSQASSIRKSHFYGKIGYNFSNVGSSIDLSSPSYALGYAYKPAITPNLALKFELQKDAKKAPAVGAFIEVEF